MVLHFNKKNKKNTVVQFAVLLVRCVLLSLGNEHIGNVIDQYPRQITSTA